MTRSVNPEVRTEVSAAEIDEEIGRVCHPDCSKDSNRVRTEGMLQETTQVNLLANQGAFEVGIAAGRAGEKMEASQLASEQVTVRVRPEGLQRENPEVKTLGLRMVRAVVYTQVWWQAKSKGRLQGTTVVRAGEKMEASRVGMPGVWWEVWGPVRQQELKQVTKEVKLQENQRVTGQVCQMGKPWEREVGMREETEMERTKVIHPETAVANQRVCQWVRAVANLLGNRPAL